MRILSSSSRAATIFLLSIITLAPISQASAAGTTAHEQYVEAVKDLRAAGIATTTAEIWPAAAPNDQNAAPLYANLEADYPANQAETDALAVTTGTPKESDWDKARAFVDGNPKLLDLVHKIAGMPDNVMAGRLDAKDQLAIRFPELAQNRRAERIIAIESALMAHDGHAVDAIHTAALGFQLADHGYQEPTLIGYLVGVAIDAIAVNNIDRIMVANRANPDAVAAAQTALSSWRGHSLRHAVSGEVVCALTAISTFRAGDPSKYADLAGEDAPASVMLAAKSTQTWQDFIDANGLVVIRYEKSAFDVCDHPYPSASKEFEDLDASLDRHTDDYTLVHIFCPGYSKTAAKKAMIEARVDLANACAAVLAYHNSHGDYPGNLAQAMTNVPIDPFDLQPIRYRPDGGGFVVYSVGESGKYAGGAATTNDNVLRVDANGGVSFK